MRKIGIARQELGQVQQESEASESGRARRRPLLSRGAAFAGTAAVLASSTVVFASPASADDGLSRKQLLNDCPGRMEQIQIPQTQPGIPIYKPARKLDGCTFESSEEWDAWEWRDTGQTVTNCNPGATQPIQHRSDSTEAWSAGWNVGGELGFDAGKFAGGLNASYNWSNTVSRTNSNTVTISPGRKGSLTAGAEIHHAKGRIRVNYGEQAEGHYIWYINDVEISTPTGKTEIGQEDKSCTERLMNGQ
ncbi:hypothetical protein [Streptomyces sp. CT34]|uniref:hypothetical protein n=1 Tax=Streptomyces sp. CT34 TaxID=1553907 RepID=UPI0005B9840A|nr:hypothetical protein [Streptomyces sp. CT34]